MPDGRKTESDMRIQRDASEEKMILAGHCRATAYALLSDAFEGAEACIEFCSAEALLRKAPKPLARIEEKGNKGLPEFL